MGRVYISHSESCQEDSFTQCNKEDRMVRKSTRPVRFNHLMAFNIRESNDEISGMVSVEFDYYSYNDSIRYRELHYSDPRLIKHIEGNPLVVKNIDSYLRKNLVESEYGFKF